MTRLLTTRFCAASVVVALCMLAGTAGAQDNRDIARNRIFAPGGQVEARIETTTNGVPHITADNLESAAFGEGFVQARDNVCVIADAILRATGTRAKYYGPGPDNINVITDFSYRALGLLDKARADYDRLSPASRAMLQGFAAGYNRYVKRTDPSALPGKCRTAAWVQPITPEQLYAYYQVIALFASGDQLATGATFAAAPPGVDPSPRPVTPGTDAELDMSQGPDFARLARRGTPADIGQNGDLSAHDMGSNGWGIGGQRTENGRGALLANPHFPYTGSRRLYQSQITVPGVYNVNGATLIGFVVPLIGFNQHLGWTHTVSTARHFTLYRLQLAAGNALSYIKDGQRESITEKTLTIEVANGSPTPTRLQKTFYYSEYGPMLAANLINASLPAWGDQLVGTATAFAYRDANADTARQVVDQWLAMGRARNLAQFKQSFQRCGSVLWVNTMYADDNGQAFYIDASSVPRLSPAARAAFRERLRRDPLTAGLNAAGITLLDGSTGRDDWVSGACNGRVSYAGNPQLTRRDFVQNSNDSYWATQPEALLTGYSPLYGPVASALSPRTRMGLKMLEHPRDPGLSRVAPAGDDGLFNAREIIDALYSDRAYYAETLLPTLVQRCLQAGNTRIHTDASGSARRGIVGGCVALANWDGVYDLDSRGAAAFRVFIAHYDPEYPEQFSVAFDPAQPATTPSTPRPAPADPARDPMLVALAQGLNTLDEAGIAYNAPLGQIQREQQSEGAAPGGSSAAAGGPIPWHGTQNMEGGFNIVRPDTAAVDDGTRYPRVTPAPTLADSGDLSAKARQGWLIAYGTSWHFGLDFTAAGPRAFGLVSYGQSDDPSSPYFADQDRRYSAKDYRRLRYSRSAIESDPNLVTETVRGRSLARPKN